MVTVTKIIAALLLLAGLALGGYAWFLGRNPAKPPPAAASAAPSYPVVVALKSLPAGQAIKVEDLKVEQLSIRPADAFQDVAAVAGHVPIIDLGAGAPIGESQLATGLAGKIAPGERAVAIKVDEAVGVGNKIRPGDFVDVFFVLKRDGGEIDRSQARLLLAKKRVLAYGVFSLDGMPSSASAAAGNAAARQEPARTAVLAVPVEEVNQLALGEANGRLLLALRNPKDVLAPDADLFSALPTVLAPVSRQASRAISGPDRALAGTSLPDLANRGGRPPSLQMAPLTTRRVAKPQAPPTSLSVEVIRGSKQEVLSY
jgi:pilus assembly protein CpaB